MLTYEQALRQALEEWTLPSASPSHYAGCAKTAGSAKSRMAKRLGISRPTYNRLENADQNTTLRTLGQLCRAMRCDIGELFSSSRTRRR
jgi:DNA-binding XRE family transcriptional regulator